ncbi:hypothetical protein OIU34_18235 [Pararhizobium sp. BT-229]|uniref:hypothetical protein n=1 Tax=Pararhizobium sp. BT-229 TaxID=2986923 RepID=UPI0021F79551|nr:hypothetical protein [Pararhizobium sp. BT-229]MCV9963819.1 hypothetical protein [Pararhizobium sp. BT-229]
MAPGTKSTKQKIVETTTSILTGELAGDVASFIRSVAHRRFSPDNTLEKRVLLHEAVRSYLSNGSREAASRVVSEGVDPDVTATQLVNLVSDADGLDAITDKVRAIIEASAPELRTDRLREVVGRTTLYHLVDEIDRADSSKPLDIANGKEVTVCFIPGSSRVQNYWDTATRSWMERSDSISIYPDRTFIDFLGVVGVSKTDWLSAVERNTTMSSAARMRDHLEERAAAWEAVPEWETAGSLDIEDDDLVAAVDACPYGFTPMIAFTMQAEEILAMDFTETLEVTGGIVGLHDFTTGSGDPLRFEGTLRFTPGIGDMHLADDQPLGLIATHGFLSSAFVSTVTRAPAIPSDGTRTALSPVP